jgi:hypothetical protein
MVEETVGHTEKERWWCLTITLLTAKNAKSL